MSRYSCHECRAEHGTDNMVAYCAACFSRLKAILAEKEKKDEEHGAFCAMALNKQAVERAEKAEAARKARKLDVTALRDFDKAQEGK